MTYNIAQHFPYAHTLSVRPGGEIKYTVRLLPPDKCKAAPGKVSHHLPNLHRASGAPRDSVAPLAVRANFTKPRFHIREGSNGYGKMPEFPVRFTPRAKNSVRFAASALEYRFGVHRCYFLTGTLPGSTPQALKALAEWSSWFVDCLNKWLKDNYSIDGKCYRVSVWELQRRGALHLHAIVVADSSIIQAFQAYWIHLLESLSDRIGVDLFARSSGGSWRGRYDSLTKSGQKVRDIIAFSAQVEKSVSSYLSKYLVPECGDFRKTSPRYYPSRWWSISRASQSESQAQTIKIPLPRMQAGEQQQGIDDFVMSVLDSAGLKVAESVSPYPRFNEDGSFREFQHVHTGWVAWGDYDHCVEVARLIASTIEADLDFRGNISQLSKLRSDYAYGDIQKAVEWKEAMRDLDGLQTLDYIQKSKYERQKENYRRHLLRDNNFYSELNAELLQIRQSMDSP